ncbi:hypothetical protein PV08_06831 [Exophiala spinifera]|uniref:Peroxisomal membrane protein PEX14 n=1 Tax=Exophiala spinifera TaxID=91928 RepID=A0A0D2B5W7_9EURO|nr:uncharacterized protein PV08_06831 [Exophiala spinifera]KIW14050.1 hypothetical protein PV08_06831 [Exophiala spinifera]
MADTGPRKGPSIPAWQQKSATDAQQPSGSNQETDDSTSSSTSSDLPVVEQARKFLEDDSIRDAPRERKVAFLEQKGLTSDQIEQLLSSDQKGSSLEDSVDPSSSEIKTVHDTTQPTTPHSDTTTASTTPSPSSNSAAASSSSKRDVPPIITYPEFLLQPQKPPPLVTFSRLANAAYGFAGLATLTYAASTYIVEPMLETLTSARHDLASTALADLAQLNAKLESTVSHVPYIPPLHAATTTTTTSSSSKLKSSSDAMSDVSYSDSDPTELFHRDIATQTSPPRSRSPSFTSHPYDHHSLSAQDPTASQSTRLRSLHSTLSSLLSSTDSRYSQGRLKDTMTEMQAVLDKMSNTYNPFQTDFGTASTPSFTSTGYGGPGGSGAMQDKNKTKRGSDNEAQKFRAEIRALKGAFLSSRNFPTARPAAPFAMPGAGRSGG